MLPPNMAPWDIEYFKLTEFERQHVQKGLSDLPPKSIRRPLCERCLTFTWRKGTSVSLKTRRTPDAQALLSLLSSKLSLLSLEVLT